jgi:DNA-binding MarR family transcriptional regulator
MTDPQAIYALLNEIYLILDDGDRRLLNRFQLSPARFYALIHLRERPGMSLRELSGLMLCDKSNATRIFRAMENDGLVYRKPHETDRRALRLYLSPEGEKLCREVLASHEHFNESRFSGIEQDEQGTLFKTLRHLKRDLGDHLEGAHIA